MSQKRSTSQAATSSAVWLSGDAAQANWSGATIGGGASDLDQFSLEQDAAIRGPRTSVETEVGKEVRSEFAEVSRRVGSFDQPDVDRERSSTHRRWGSKLLDAPASSDDVVGGEAHRTSQAHIVEGSPHSSLMVDGIRGIEGRHRHGGSTLRDRWHYRLNLL